MTDLWDTERSLWLEGVDAYDRHLATVAIMVFGPMGIMDRKAILTSLKDATRWSDVELSQRTTTSPSPDVTVLAYGAEAKIADETYSALCSSTYVRIGEDWWLVQHQQTPVAQPGAGST